MGTGPEVGPGGYDLALTERVDDDGRRYLVDVGSADGAEILAALPPTETPHRMRSIRPEPKSPGRRTAWAGRCPRRICVTF